MVEAEIRGGAPGAQERLRKALEMNALIAAAVPVVEPPRRLRNRVLAIARPEQQGRWAANLAWAGLCAALVAALVYTAFDRQSAAAELAEVRQALDQTRNTLSLREAALEFLRRPDTRMLKTGAAAQQQPVAKVFVNPQQGVLMVANNLPRLEPGRTFEMWIVPKAGNPRPFGLFKALPDGSAMHLQTAPVSLDEAAAVALSIEPEGGSPQPTTTPFLITPIAE
jgi:hypothetical protein